MIRATWKGGCVILDEPVEWPEGARLVVQPDLPQEDALEDLEARTPDAIEHWLRWYDSLEPLIFTLEEEDWRT